MGLTGELHREDDPDAVVSAMEGSALGTLPREILAGLAQASRPVRFSADDVLMREGEPGRALFLILTDRAEVATRSGASLVPLAAVGPNDLVGELALLTDEPVRRATVTAIEPMWCAEIDADDLHRALATDADASAQLRRAADQLVVARLLRAVAPLAGLDDAQARQLADRVTELTVKAGEAIVEAGHLSDSCFVMRSGRAEVLVSGSDVSPAELRPGSLFGEVGLLAEEPRTATVRAIEDCRVVVLDRDAVLEVSRADPRFAREATQLLRLRERPRRAEGIETQIVSTTVRTTRRRR